MAERTIVKSGIEDVGQGPAVFAELLQAFAAAVVANDGGGLGQMFTPDGIYEDGFFGPHAGREAIAAMLQRFHDTGGDYRWEFFDAVGGGAIGYARFRFSYVSRLPESPGRPVAFEGISVFYLRDGLIARYAEIFDRGLALVQLDFPAERIERVLRKAAAAQNAHPELAPHLDRFRNGGPPG
ncbi:MAG: nuclear transport factor 2 family protein [Alphaproteobacteria bacterium]|nr:nuclear transport factor 2 family protein [Alphaproteobacteria bacterium]